MSASMNVKGLGYGVSVDDAGEGESVQITRCARLQHTAQQGRDSCGRFVFQANVIIGEHRAAI